MGKLIIKNYPSIKIRRGLGIFIFLIAVLWIFIFFDSRSVFNFISFTLWAFVGAYHFTEGFGFEKEFIETAENGLNIKLQNRIKPVLISDSEIENICLRKSEIVINRVNNKPLKLKRKYLENKQMTEVYQFFIDYSKEKNLTIIRDF
jgi:hypothetical protein